MARKVVLIDDQPEKNAAINRFFENNYPDDKVTWFKNFRQSQNNLLVYDFDLLILDMSFEVHGAVSEDLAFNGLAGLHVLQFMWISEIELPTIIFTSHDNYSDPDFGEIKGIEELNNHTKRIFGDLVLGCVKMSLDENEWNNKLKEIIDDARI